MSDEERMSGSHECGDAAAYVLGALDPQELEAFRAHLEHCTICRDEVSEFGLVMEALPIAVPQHRVPRSMRRRLMREVRREPRAATARSDRAARRQARRAPAWSPAALGRRGWAAAGAFSAVAVAAVVAVLTLSSGPATSVFQARVSGIAGSAQVRVTNGHAQLVVSHMTPPGRRHVYEVWLESGNAKPVPASVLFGVSADGNADVGLPAKLRGVSAVLVTQEPLGGSPGPTHAPVIVAKLN
jgi:anti-sigma-K factor RskA